MTTAVMRILRLQIHHVCSTLFVLWLSRHVQTAAGEPGGLESVSTTGLARFSNAPQTPGVTYRSTDSTTDAAPNPVIIFKDRRAIEPSTNAVAAMLDLYNHIEKYASSLGTELFTGNNLNLTFILGSIEVSLHVASRTARRILGRRLFPAGTHGDLLSEFVKELRGLTIRGLITLGEVLLFVNNLICLTMVIAVLGPHTRQRPNVDGLPEMVT